MHDVLIEKLEGYLSLRNEVAFTFLYGSQANGNATELSDVDIAVYFYPLQQRELDFEQEIIYPTEDEIWADLEELLHKEVELLVLNRVSASVAASAIRGKPIIIRDWGLYLDFMLAITSEAEDFMDLIINDYMDKTVVEERN